MWNIFAGRNVARWKARWFSSPPWQCHATLYHTSHSVVSNLFILYTNFELYRGTFLGHQRKCFKQRLMVNIMSELLVIDVFFSGSLVGLGSILFSSTPKKCNLRFF
ncbi:hypothetical protein FRX31_007059 [Thalictrum thalictroides]|uniref:Uncharacterized protein n=1 Tax=Thalictrum thalictroides TaxID=46969 RepID=A0A7J6X1Z7_THATH|nr:hypothetical protein FRX31_007059 [Thalictrum thalictroides]